MNTTKNSPFYMVRYKIDFEQQLRTEATENKIIKSWVKEAEAKCNSINVAVLQANNPISWAGMGGPTRTQRLRKHFFGLGPSLCALCSEITFTVLL